MSEKEKDIVIRQQRLLLKARVAIAYGETALLDEIERELEILSSCLIKKIERACL